MTNKGWCEYCYLKDEKPCYECSACFKGSNFRAIKTIKPTNYERIKNMRVEELAQLLNNFRACSRCPKCGNNCFPNLNIEQWLESEVTDNA